jgi:hypothetical protein
MYHDYLIKIFAKRNEIAHLILQIAIETDFILAIANESNCQHNVYFIYPK